MRAHSLREACLCAGVHPRVYGICTHINIARSVPVCVRACLRVWTHARVTYPVCVRACLRARVGTYMHMNSNTRIVTEEVNHEDRQALRYRYGKAGEKVEQRPRYAFTDFIDGRYFFLQINCPTSGLPYNLFINLAFHCHKRQISFQVTVLPSLHTSTNLPDTFFGR